MSLSPLEPDLRERLVSIDVETTDFPHLPTTRIIEFGAVEVVGGKINQNSKFSCYVACAEMSVPGAFQKHQLTPEFLMRNGKPVDEALEEFLSFIGDAPLLCHGFWHGVNCDEEVVNNELKRIGRSVLTNCIVQTTKIFGFVTLSDLCSRYGIPNAGAHGALRDAEMLAEVYLKHHERVKANEGVGKTCAAATEATFQGKQQQVGGACRDEVIAGKGYSKTYAPAANATCYGHQQPQHAGGVGTGGIIAGKGYGKTLATEASATLQGQRQQHAGAPGGGPPAIVGASLDESKLTPLQRQVLDQLQAQDKKAWTTYQ